MTRFFQGLVVGIIALTAVFKRGKDFISCHPVQNSP